MMKLFAIKIARTSCFLGAICALGMFGTNANAQITVTNTIYQDDFSGDIATDLGLTVPDVSPTGTENWITAFSRQNGGSDNGSAQIFNADGTVIKAGSNAVSDAGAVLPFTILPNTVYTLETSFTNNNNNWVAAGFSSSTAQLDGTNGRHSNGNGGVFGGYAWALSRSDAAASQQIFNGIGTGNGVTGGSGNFADSAEEVIFSIVLDTANITAITADYFFNGVQVGGTQTLPAAAFGNIDFVGISSDGLNGPTTDTASFSSFSLTATTTVAVPEPSSLAFLGLGSVALIARRRKS